MTPDKYFVMVNHSKRRIYYGDWGPEVEEKFDNDRYNCTTCSSIESMNHYLEQEKRSSYGLVKITLTTED